MEKDSTLSLEVLFAYHKQEASEEMTYLTIIFTVVLGILGYLGSAKRIEKPVRIGIAIVFLGFLISFLVALSGSVVFHDALHVEIKEHAKKHPELFVLREKSQLYMALTQNLKAEGATRFVIGGSVLGAMVIAGLLMMGAGRVFPPESEVSSKQRKIKTEGSE